MRLPAARAAMLAMASSAVLAGSVLAQDAADGSTRRAVEPPRTSGQAPREIQAPIGHRQPAAKDVPSDGDQAAAKAANREIDRRLNICRGC